MFLRASLHTVVPMIAVAIVAFLVPNTAFAHFSHHICGGGGGGGSVPEIATGSAAGALALLVGSVYLIKDRLLATRNRNAAE